MYIIIRSKTKNNKEDINVFDVIFETKNSKKDINVFNILLINA